MPRTKSNSFKQANSNYQSLYLWTSFLLGMISLGIVIWNRGKTSSVAMVNHNVIPGNARDLPGNSLVIPAQAGIQSSFLDSEFMDSRLRGNDDSISIYRINFQTFVSSLALSALTYQQFNSWVSGLLVGMSSYISKTNAQAGSALTIDLDKLNQTQGVILNGDQYAGSYVYAQDVNNDTYTDLLIGAYGASKAYLVYGPNFNTSNLDNLSNQKGVIFNGGGYAGISVYAKDVNKDGHIDVLIGAYFAAKTYLVYGPNFSNATALDGLTGTRGVIFIGSGMTGYSVYAEDMNDDGFVDILIGSYASKAYLVYGPNFANSANLNNLSGVNGVIFTGGTGTGSSFYAADLNKDKHLDLLIGAFNSQGGANKVYLIYGPNFANATSLNNLNQQKGIIFSGSSGTGFSVFAADVNTDGWVDVLIGTYDANKAYLAYGPFENATNLDSLSGTKGLIFSGGSGAVYATDTNGDGNIDVLIGSYLNNKLYILYGPDHSNSTSLQNLQFKQGVIFTGDRWTGYSLFAGDINSDGCVDILTSAHAASKVYFVLNQAFTSCLPRTTLAPSTSTISTTTIPTTTTPNLSVFSQTTSLSFSKPEMLPTTATTSGTIINQSPTIIIPTSLTSFMNENTSQTVEENNTLLYAGIGGAAGSVALLLGGIGLFACYQKRKNQQSFSQNNAVSLRDESMKSSTQSNIYTAAPLMSGEGNSERPSLVRPDYVQIDETKKTEKEYDRMPKLEI